MIEVAVLEQLVMFIDVHCIFHNRTKDLEQRSAFWQPSGQVVIRECLSRFKAHWPSNGRCHQIWKFPTSKRLTFSIWQLSMLESTGRLNSALWSVLFTWTLEDIFGPLISTSKFEHKILMLQHFTHISHIARTRPSQQSKFIPVPRLSVRLHPSSIWILVEKTTILKWNASCAMNRSAHSDAVLVNRGRSVVTPILNYSASGSVNTSGAFRCIKCSFSMGSWPLWTSNLFVSARNCGRRIRSWQWEL